MSSAHSPKTTQMDFDQINAIPADQPVLIAGPTASGKSALALHLAQTRGGMIINADAIQVYENWRVLSARPSPDEETSAPHFLYGHLKGDQAYSVGHWLREVAPLLKHDMRPIIVGGTGLYFTALTEGLADIPATPPGIRAQADGLSLQDMLDYLDQNDPELAARIDRMNRARVQRGYEVLMATGKPLSAWQNDTGPALLPGSEAVRIVLNAPRDWLADRIEARCDIMLQTGALDEARANLDHWSPTLPSAKCIGAPELIAHLRGEMPLEDTREAIIIATRQFAKRQRTWFRARMRDWIWLSPEKL